MHDRLGERVGHFPRNQEELKEMQMHEFLKNSYFTKIQTFIMWNQRKFVISQFGRQSFPDGVQKG